MNISKNLVASLVLAVMVLSGLLVYQSFGQKSILGESTIETAKILPSDGFCYDLMRITDRYCQSNKPTPPPTEVTVILERPTPTATLCKTGLNSFSAGSSCKGFMPQSTYISARYSCYDGYSGEVKSSERSGCMTSTQLQMMAIRACSGRSNCKPVPSVYKN